MTKERKALKCNLSIPFIFGPNGEFDYTYEGQVYHIKIEHKTLTPMHTLVPNIGNLHEIYHGFSMVQLLIPKPFDQWSEKSTEILYEKILGFLTEFQYHYLRISEDYLWVSLMKEYIPTINIQDDEEGIMLIISQRDIWRRLPKRSEEKDIRASFKELIESDATINSEFIYLIDARKHYAIGEYHIMYVELAIILEILNKRALEQNIIKPVEGLSKQSIRLLTEYGWNKSKINKIKQLCKIRNKIVHERAKDFSPNDALKHLQIIEEVVKDLNPWLSNSSKQ